MARAVVFVGSLLTFAHAGNKTNVRMRTQRLRGSRDEKLSGGSSQRVSAQDGSATPWGETFVSKNCYEGQGGTPISEDKHLKYEECFHQCDWTDGCSCITTGIGRESDACYFLANCDISNCEDSGDWMVTVLPSDVAAFGGICPQRFPFIGSDNKALFIPDSSFAFDSVSDELQWPYKKPFNSAFPCGVDLDESFNFGYIGKIEEDAAGLEAYLTKVYGERAVQSGSLPSTDDLTFFWNNAPLRDQLIVPRVPYFGDHCQMRFGQPFAPFDGSTWEDYAGKRHTYPGFFMVPKNDEYQLLPQSYDWVEVMHTGRNEDHVCDHEVDPGCDDTQDISSAGQFWYWFAPGSGIWLYTGNMFTCDTAGVEACGDQQSKGCRFALDNGYDTLLNIPQSNGDGTIQYGGMVEIVDCRAAQDGKDDLLDKLWEGSCPPPGAGELRSGLPWKDTDGGDEWSCDCKCDKSKWYLNCEGQ